MTIGEIIEELKTTNNYLITRLKYDDKTIEFLSEQFPQDYKYIKEKEDAFIDVRNALNNGNTFN